ncbi:FAD-linked oxidase [Ilyomonas limi]|uniref:FAD-linked oxidase n=1 Tax=Ilyomonas limi TaxID=2575867 RepID=A0A4U3L4D5_9BACT|nr:FAD-binding protein [Ilyomonas limi]TKK68476.1 FAD-linked oxidase [Ilyomonas limi]
MATTVKHEIGSWDTFHNNGPFPTKVLYETLLEAKGNMPSITDRYNDAAAEIQRLIQLALSNREGFRAYGSAWSMSHIAHQKDNMHFNTAMNLKRTIDVDELHPNATYVRENLFFFECGNIIKEINQFLFDNGKSLKTTGASNGQTIAGCVSTGVHGSALDVGSVQDSVVGINLIIGAGIDDIVYLERHTRPALNDVFASRIKARIIRNDDLFKAALVSLGSFGFIHGITVEAENRFLLNRYVKRISKDKALQLAQTLAFEDADFVVEGETDAGGKPLRPYHYKIFINPYVNDTEYVVEAMYKKPYRSGYPDPVPRIKTAIYRDLILLFTSIAERFRNSIPSLIRLLQTSVLPPVDLQVTGTIGEIFWDAGYQGPAYACAVGVDSRDSPKALELLANLAKNEGPIPGLYAMRFVRQSDATLAFTRFPVTCMLEIDGLIWNPQRDNIISLPQFCTRIIEVLQANNIPFTIHWGKNADWSFPGLIEHMYGANAQQWKECRSALLKEETAALFSNRFLQDTGLSEYIVNAPLALAASVV